MRIQEAVFPSPSSNETTAKQEVLKSQSALWSHTCVSSEACLGTEKKEWQKMVILASCCSVFPAYLLYPFPSTLSLSYTVHRLLEMGTSLSVSVYVFI